MLTTICQIYAILGIVPVLMAPIELKGFLVGLQVGCFMAFLIGRGIVK